MDYKLCIVSTYRVQISAGTYYYIKIILYDTRTFIYYRSGNCIYYCMNA